MLGLLACCLLIAVRETFRTSDAVPVWLSVAGTVALWVLLDMTLLTELTLPPLGRRSYSSDIRLGHPS